MHISRIAITEAHLDLVLGKPLLACLKSAVGQELPLYLDLIKFVDQHGLSQAGTSFSVPLDEVAKFSEKSAVQLGLGKDCPFGLDLRLDGILGRAGTKLSFRWLKPGTSVGLTISPLQQGPRLLAGPHQFRLQSPLFEVLNLVEGFNALLPEATHQQFEYWSNIRMTLGDKRSGQLSDHFLRALRIICSDSFTLNIAQDSRGELQLVPRLLLEDTMSSEVDGRTQALSEADEAIFAQRLDLLPDGASTFPVSDGTYVVTRPSVALAMRAIKEIRKWPTQRRKDAFLKPRAAVEEVLTDLHLDCLDVPFVETDSYSQRVHDIGLWVPPVVPWLKLPSQPWLPPESCGLRIGEAELELAFPEVGELKQAVAKAIDAGKADVTFKGKSVPANESTLQALEHLLTAEREAGSSIAPEKGTKSTPKDVTSLLIRTNFESKEFLFVKTKKRAGILSMPQCLRSAPKEHQIFGINWLQTHWISGSSGAVLADDMGLGKTYQCLAYLAWLREMMLSGKIPRRPILIVAPVGLLQNWEQEHSSHLLDGGLGDVLRLYGRFLQQVKVGSLKHGTASLSTKRISEADWVLANYETIAEYQLSIGAVHFGAVIFDEAQKIKNPQARMTHAAKALNSDFNLVVTGTPVENRMSDFWCLADTAQPFCLGDLKGFSKRYESEDNEGAVRSLKSEVWQGDDLDPSRPKLMLRRMKTDNLRALPKRAEQFIIKDMPTKQSDLYASLVHGRSVPEAGKPKKTTLELIQNLRQVSLHPAVHQKSEEIDYFDSARFVALFEVLDKIFSAGEKALIFLESLALQEPGALPSFLLRRYDLKRLPFVINGDIDAVERQNRVRAFQETEGFDVMILSPKAGGVGLTLTAANHVIHLTRWWNPAVEDQCSDRVYRIGQKKDVFVYYPISRFPESPEYSFDLKLHELMMRKKILYSTLLAPTQLSKADFESLLPKSLIS